MEGAIARESLARPCQGVEAEVQTATGSRRWQRASEEQTFTHSGFRPDATADRPSAAYGAVQLTHGATALQYASGSCQGARVCLTSPAAYPSKRGAPCLLHGRAPALRADTSRCSFSDDGRMRARSIWRGAAWCPPSLALARSALLGTRSGDAPRKAAAAAGRCRRGIANPRRLPATRDGDDRALRRQSLAARPQGGAPGARAGALGLLPSSSQF